MIAATKGGDSRVHMHHGAAGKVEGAEFPQPAAGRPDPVGDRRVDQQRPESHEDDKGAELGPLGEGAGYQGGSDDGEHHLKDHERQMGYRRRVIGVRRLPHVAQEGPVEAADDAAVVGPESQAVADGYPQYAGDGNHYKAVHDRTENVLLPDQATVEESESGRH